ncbi:hypothetical protein [Ammoniphilus sp. CFH 90114]|uniref:hypothetical protein n=1 Tax=Ammoniphilus sp. CFH 90114 TaxID=2493665 RepID=UPI0010257620|nr:hypothetical protein [Ammoniphilus sp. CFH 90114]RXT08146.1 hypothetical protein EIZ39_12150 [Ammoniphilus sp. CFH 90114]
MKNMKQMHQLTSAALRFVQDVNDYVKTRGYILLQEEPIIHLKTEERLSMTITQPIYVAASDIEMNVSAYLEEGDLDEIVVESTFECLLGEFLDVQEIYAHLKQIRNERTNHFFICVRGSQEEGFCDEEISVIIRKKHNVRNDNTFEQWDDLIRMFQKGQDQSKPLLPYNPEVTP